ncbi:MAG: homoserine dehydrogenase [Candidatus Korobacteraceae bacterium]
MWLAAARRLQWNVTTLQPGDIRIRTYNLCLVGLGNVGKAFVALLQKKQLELNSRYGIEGRVTGIASRRLGWLVAPGGFTPAKVLAADFSEAQRAGDLREWLRLGQADALLETSSLNATTGQPAIDHIRAALENGAHAISANKGPVVHAYRELTKLAAAKGRRFLFESAVMDGAPIFSLFREAMPAVEIRGFRGILNSTTNLILEGMESGMTFDASVRKAQELGVAESDPTDDIEGVDAAVKVVALANVLMEADLKLDDVARQGIRGITVEQLRDARANGEAWKLVCSARRNSSRKVTASVQLERLPLSDPLAQVQATSSVISFETDILPRLIIIEQDPTVETTAYGLLADFLIAVRS